MRPNYDTWYAVFKATVSSTTALKADIAVRFAVVTTWLQRYKLKAETVSKQVSQKLKAVTQLRSFRYVTQFALELNGCAR